MAEPEEHRRRTKEEKEHTHTHTRKDKEEQNHRQVGRRRRRSANHRNKNKRRKETTNDAPRRKTEERDESHKNKNKTRNNRNNTMGKRQGGNVSLAAGGKAKKTIKETKNERRNAHGEEETMKGERMRPANAEITKEVNWEEVGTVLADTAESEKHSTQEKAGGRDTTDKKERTGGQKNVRRQGGNSTQKMTGVWENYGARCSGCPRTKRRSTAQEMGRRRTRP